MTSNTETSRDTPSRNTPGGVDSSRAMPTAGLGAGAPTVGRLALGTMTFGVETGEADAFEQLDRFVAAGGP